MSLPSAEEAARSLRAAGQSHLVEHARGLGPPEEASFLLEAARHPWADLRAALRSPPPSPPPALRPPQALTLRRQRAEGGLRPRLARRGEALLAEGRVACLLLAGGQGTRLGLAGPKGLFVLGPEPDRTLFAIHAERVLAASRRAKRPILLVVLVSGETDAPTRRAFEEARRWGLEREQVRFLVQGELPALDEQGRALLAGPGRLATAPDGHGGAIQALWASGLLEEWSRGGVDVLATFQVDNPLARPLDPVMLGWVDQTRARAAGKAVARLGPEERVGVFARDVRGRHLVVEYTEVPEDGLPETCNLGNIAVHALGVAWLQDLEARGVTLPLHLARKRVPFLSAEGATVEPDGPNAYKLERFLFDLFPHAERFQVHEVERAREFAPVKNATGEDSPETARRLVADEVRRWYAARGLPAPEPPSLRPLAMGEASTQAAP